MLPLDDVNYSIVKKIDSHDDFLILDLASGNGELPREMSFLPHSLIYSIDTSDVSIECIEKFSIPTLCPQKMNIEKLDFEDEFFDIVTFSRGIWIAEDYNKVVLEINRVLKKSGLAYFQLWTQSSNNLIFKKVSELIQKYSQSTISGLKSIYQPSYKDLNRTVLNNGFEDYQKFLFEKSYSFTSIKNFWTIFAPIAESAYLKYLTISESDRNLIDNELLNFFEVSHTITIEWIVIIYKKKNDGN
jgi:ubiquinone/menaquinone biosynthesis C-methylase UbiE